MAFARPVLLARSSTPELETADSFSNIVKVSYTALMLLIVLLEGSVPRLEGRGKGLVPGQANALPGCSVYNRYFFPIVFSNFTG